MDGIFKGKCLGKVRDQWDTLVFLHLVWFTTELPRKDISMNFYPNISPIFHINFMNIHEIWSIVLHFELMKMDKYSIYIVVVWNLSWHNDFLGNSSRTKSAFVIFPRTNFIYSTGFSPNPIYSSNSCCFYLSIFARKKPTRIFIVNSWFWQRNDSQLLGEKITSVLVYFSLNRFE